MLISTVPDSVAMPIANILLFLRICPPPRGVWSKYVVRDRRLTVALFERIETLSILQAEFLALVLHGANDYWVDPLPSIPTMDISRRAVHVHDRATVHT